MVRFIIGRSGSGKSEKIVESICDEIKNSGRNVVLIVPEQETVGWERKLASILPPSANLRLEVTNFTNLARSVFREYGGLSDSVIDDGSRMLIVWRAMQSVWDSLRVYNKLSNREDRCIPILMRAIDELKGSGITPEKAEEALERLTFDGQNDESSVKNDGKYGSFEDRLSDVVLVYAAYNSILHEEYIDKSDLETKLAKAIAENPYFCGKSVYVDSFLSFTSGQMRIIREIMQSAESFTASVMLSPNKQKSDISENEEYYVEPQFEETKETLKKLITIANRLGMDYETLTLEENLRHGNNPELKMVERLVFGSDEIPQNELDSENMAKTADYTEKNNENAVFISCRDKLDEAKICAAAVNKLLSEGYKYSDIAIVAHNVESYKGIVDTELRQHGFNLFISNSSGVTQNPAVRFVKSLVDVVSDGWQKSDILAFLKTGLVRIEDCVNDGEEADPLSLYAIEIFEKYVETWNLNYRKTYTENDWTMNPDGYKLGISEYGERVLRIVNNVRRQISEPLNSFAELFDDKNGAASVVEIAENIVRIAEEFKIDSGLGAIGRSYRSFGANEDAEKCESGWRIVCEILDKIVEFLGDCKIDAKKFGGLFAGVAKSMEVGSIPSGSNEIVIGNAQGIRLENKKCIIILGANEGEFPGEADSERQFFSDTDKLKLETYGIEIGGDNAETLGTREYCMFYRTVSAPSDKLIILSEEKKNMSGAAADIVEKLGKKVLRSNELDIDFLVFDKKSAEEYLFERGCENSTEIANKLYGNDLIKDETADISADSADLTETETNEKNDNILYLSQSKINTYLRCPFNYACKYKMKLKPRAVGEMTLPDIGIIVHMILQRYFEDKYCKKIKSELSLEERLDEIIGEIKEKLAVMIGENDPKSEYLYIRIRRQMLLMINKTEDEIATSGFVPAYAEQKIGRGGIRPIEFRASNGRLVVIEGIADRIDEKIENGKKFLRIVDYKTGNKSFKMENLENGTEIQLLVYLFSILNDKKLYGKEEIGFGGAMYISYNLGVVQAERGCSMEKIYSEAREKILFSGVSNEIFENDEKAKITYINERILEKTRNKLEDEIRKVSDDILHNIYTDTPNMIDGIDPCDWCDNAYICRHRRKNG